MDETKRSLKVQVTYASGTTSIFVVSRDILLEEFMKLSQRTFTSGAPDPLVKVVIGS